MKIAALPVAAGKGIRAGGDLPKQYRTLAGSPVLRHTLRAFAEHPSISRVRAVIGEGWDESFAELSEGLSKVGAPILGGTERQSSVRLGLEALSEDAPDLVLIHDGARPLVSADTISNVIAAAQDAGGAIAALPVSDTLKRSAGDELIAETVPRTGLWRAQTPQGFGFAEILRVHREMADREDMTDDASLFEAAGLPVRLVEDRATNIKITRPEDFALAELLMTQMSFEPRVGSGFDVHAFEEGDHVTLCGIDIPHDARLAGHSDADVAWHALTDAILGALGAGDIGDHFPPSDPQWKGAPSKVFLQHAVKVAREAGYVIGNCDLTIVCEAPKIKPHREAMRTMTADIMALDKSQVSIKATTTEGLGFTGRREGIAAQAAVLLSPKLQQD